jgi:hypothetical protein
MKKDPSLAHYNILPEAEMAHLDNAIGSIAHVAYEAHAVSNIVDTSHVLIKNS